MRNLSFFLLAGLALLPATSVRASAADAEAEIRGLERQWEGAFKVKDPAAIMRFYAPGSKLLVFDVIPPRQYVGHEAYEKDWEDFFGAFDGPITFEMNDLIIETGAGDLAYSHSIQRVAGKLKKGGNLDLTVRVTDVYRKTAGKWLIVHEHVSVPVDLDTGKADLESKP